MFDAFHIQSGWLHFSQGSGAVAGLFDRPAEAPGTRVAMQIDNLSRRTTREVFNDYAAPEEFSFAKSLVPVALARSEGDKLVSRSQSKRLTLRLERFQTVVLDFAGINNIGQGKMTFSVPATSTALATSVNTGLAPATMTLTMDPGRIATTLRQPGTNLYNGNFGTALNINLASPEAIRCTITGGN